MQELVFWRDKQNRQDLNLVDEQAHEDKKREDPNKTIRNERGETTTDTTEIKRIVRNYYEELYAKKCENLDEMDKFQENISFQKSMKKKQKTWTHEKHLMKLKQ